MNGLDDRDLKLLEADLSKKVGDNVRNSLFGAYLLLGSAVSATLALVGYNLIDSAKTQADRKIQEAITSGQTSIQVAIADNQKDLEAFKQSVRGEIDEYKKYFEGKKNEIDLIEDGIKAALEKSRFISDEVIKKLANMDTATDDVQPRLARLTAQSQKIEDEQVKLQMLSQDLETSFAKASEASKTVQADVARFEALPDRLTQLASDVQKLALDMSKLASSPEGAVEKENISQSAAQTATNVETTSAKIEADQNRPVIFLQYYAMPAETANVIAANLRQNNFVVPAIDNEPMSKAGLRAVRFYNASDAETAARVANLAEAALSSANLQPGMVKVQDLTSWKGPKPKPGTLELWLGEPATSNQ